MTGSRRLAFAIFAADPERRAAIRPEERAQPRGLQGLGRAGAGAGAGAAAALGGALRGLSPDARDGAMDRTASPD